MKRVVMAGLIALAGCASTGDSAPSPPATAGVDPRLAELQTSLTELLERLDVLNDRIQRLEERAIAPAPGEPSGAPAPPPVPSRPVAAQGPSTSLEAGSGASQRPSRSLASASIADKYRRAVGLFASGRPLDSRQIFQEVFDADPASDLADNALFWIGETYYSAGDYPGAMRYYKRVITEFGDQNKAPDALFKIALAYEKTGDLALARSSFEEVIRKYPYSTPAASAKQELKRIQY
jgi:tol-pal system protein YbgF